MLQTFFVLAKTGVDAVATFFFAISFFAQMLLSSVLPEDFPRWDKPSETILALSGLYLVASFWWTKRNTYPPIHTKPFLRWALLAGFSTLSFLASYHFSWHPVIWGIPLLTAAISLLMWTSRAIDYFNACNNKQKYL